MNIPELLVTLEQCIADRSFEEVRRIAHSVKNNFHWMGLNHISEKLREVEQDCCDESLNWEEVKDLLEKMKEGLVYVQKEQEKLQSFLLNLDTTE